MSNERAKIFSEVTYDSLMRHIREGRRTFFVSYRDDSKSRIGLAVIANGLERPIGQISASKHGDLYEDIETFAYAGRKIEMKTTEDGTIRFLATGADEGLAKIGYDDPYSCMMRIFTTVRRNGEHRQREFAEPSLAY